MFFGNCRWRNGAEVAGGYDLSGLLPQLPTPFCSPMRLLWMLMVLFARLALIEDQSCQEPQPLRLFEAAVKLVFQELWHFEVIAWLFSQITVYSNRFVLCT